MVLWGIMRSFKTYIGRMKRVMNLTPLAISSSLTIRDQPSVMTDFCSVVACE